MLGLKRTTLWGAEVGRGGGARTWSFSFPAIVGRGGGGDFSLRHDMFLFVDDMFRLKMISLVQFE